MTPGHIAASDLDLLPHDDDAERAIAGAVLIDEDALPRAQEAGLTPGDFHHRTLGWILGAAEHVALRGEPVGLDSVARVLEHEVEIDGNRLELAGGVVGLTNLIAQTASSAYTPYYARIIVRDARRRKLIAAGAAITAAAGRHTEELGPLYDEVGKLLFDAMERSDDDSHLYGGPDAIEGYRHNQEERKARLSRDPNALLKTHWVDVDKRIGDFQPGHLVIIGASTSVGKTMAMEQIAEANAKHGHRVAYYHLELSHQNMQDRCVARYSGVDSRDLRKGTLTPAVERALEDIGKWYANIVYVFCPGWSAERVAADIARLHARGQCDLAIVDYMQKLSTPPLKGFNAAQVVGNKAETLKNTAERCGVPIIMGSQVNREFKRSANHRPSVDDLRDSGEIAEKANLALMLHNPTAREERDNGEPTEIIECYIEKSTDGPLGMVKLVHVKGRFLLGDLVEEGQRRAAPAVTSRFEPFADEEEITVPW